MYYVYILASLSRRLYIGITRDLERRVWEHQQGIHSNSFTARYHINRLVWFAETMDVREAILREKQLKGWLRAKKIALIEETNPEWMDLSRQVPRFEGKSGE